MLDIKINTLLLLSIFAIASLQLTQAQAPLPKMKLGLSLREGYNYYQGSYKAYSKRWYGSIFPELVIVDTLNGFIYKSYLRSDSVITEFISRKYSLQDSSFKDPFEDFEEKNLAQDKSDGYSYIDSFYCLEVYTIRGDSFFLLEKGIVLDEAWLQEHPNLFYCSAGAMINYSERRNEIIDSTMSLYNDVDLHDYFFSHFFQTKYYDVDKDGRNDQIELRIEEEGPNGFGEPNTNSIKITTSYRRVENWLPFDSLQLNESVHNQATYLRAKILSSQNWKYPVILISLKNEYSNFPHTYEHLFIFFRLEN